MVYWPLLLVRAEGLTLPEIDVAVTTAPRIGRFSAAVVTRPRMTSACAARPRAPASVAAESSRAMRRGGEITFYSDAAGARFVAGRCGYVLLKYESDLSRHGLGCR